MTDEGRRLDVLSRTTGYERKRSILTERTHRLQLAQGGVRMETEGIAEKPTYNLYLT